MRHGFKSRTGYQKQTASSNARRLRVHLADTKTMPLLHREDLEELEQQQLAPCAAFSQRLGERRFEEKPDPLRTAFQRDRDRIIHSTAFRRLQHKTQVFAAHAGDHFRSRMTHSLEVSQMARNAAIALRLNADLTEAIALAHDLGHPPFGHVGESVLDDLVQDEGGFRHNAQGSRIVDLLEDRHGEAGGLNLTIAMRRSLLKGVIPEGFPLSPDLLPKVAPPIEAVLVDLCDKIAYICHDLDDGIRAELLAVQDVKTLALWQRAESKAGTDRISRIHSEMVAIMVHDLIESSAIPYGPDADHAARPVIQHSGPILVESQELLAFLRERFYRSSRILADMDIGRKKIRFHFQDMVNNPDKIPDTMRRRTGSCSTPRLVCDYLAGMTDRFLMSQ
jgi:dGTPase